MRKITLLLQVLLLALAQQLYADAGWIDVTDTYISNPRFDNNNVSGWLGTQFNISGNSGENGEHYQKTFDSYQELTGLTPGVYRVSVQAFYRSGSATDDYTHFTSADPAQYQKVQLYATSSTDDVYSLVALASSGVSEIDLGGGSSQVSGGFIPNTQAGARNWFNAGYYNNSVEVRVDDDGALTIGISQWEFQAGSNNDAPWGWGGWGGSSGRNEWTCCDNWKLEYMGELVSVQGVSFSNTTATINVDESFRLSASVQPADATIQRMLWESSDPSIAAVDQEGNVTGIGRGTAVITATATDGTGYYASCEVTVSYQGGSSESMIINEIMPANIDMFVDPSWNYGGWLELYNPTDRSANIGRYWVSDDPANLKKAMLPGKIGSVPAHGYFTLWFDHADTRKDIGEQWLNTQVNMQLSVSGGTIYISDDQGNLIVSQQYPAAIMRASYARKIDGGEEWGWTSNPTPTASNGTSTFATQQLPVPEVDQPGKLFTSPFDVRVTIPEGETLMYTTDGTTPTLFNGTVAGSGGLFNVSETTTFRFRLFRQGYLPSDVVTRSYIYRDRDYYLPVVSIVTDGRNLYDSEIGIAVSGTNGKTANMDATKRNFNMEWDRPANFEYIIDNKEVVNQEVNIAINGGWSRKYTPKSFKLKANSLYGVSNFSYPFFQDKPYNRNKSVILRNGGNDNYNKYRLKDAALQEVARLSGFKLNLQSYQPVHVFINGQSYAMLNMREPSNKNWAYANEGTDNDLIDAFEMSVDSGYVQKSGTRDAFDAWYDKTVELAADPQNSEIYRQICEMVDIDNYVNYFAYKFFLNDWDWPHNNCKGYRDRKDGKFRFIVFDLDNCVDRSGNNIFNDFANKRIYTFYSRPEYGNTSLTKEVELVTMFLNMLENDVFRKKFIDTYCIVGGCVFRDDEENAAIVNEMAQNIRTALRWEGNDPVGTNKERSQGIINAITGTFKSRMMNVMKQYSKFGLGRTELQAIQLSANVDGARMTINGIEVPKSKFNGYLFAPDTLRAYDVAGYKFMGWRDDEVPTDAVSDLVTTGDTWKYYQSGSLDGKTWKSINYLTGTWPSGTAPFGFANAGKPMANAATTLDRYDENNNSRPTYYFRKEFTLKQAPAEGETFTFKYEVDDGMIVYVNGQEVGTYHMPSGAAYADYVQDFENLYEGDTPYSGTLQIDPSVFVQGKNVIAVEVHNCNATSTDIWFEGSLTISRPVSPEHQNGMITTDAEYIIPATGTHTLTACYEKLSDEELMATRTSPVCINEVSAANDIRVNEYNKKNDWVELYNTTDEDIDLTGMYLSDNLNKPQKYQFATVEGVDNVIPARGFKIVWCDKLEPLSQLHASFKLASEGGDVVLTAANGEWADTLSYQAHSAKETVGRYPDGNANVYLMAIPTIAAGNRISSYDSLYMMPTGTQTAIDAVMAQKGESSVTYEHGYIRVSSNVASTAEVTVYMTTGQRSLSANISISGGEGSLYVGNLPFGIYVADVKVGGESCSCKFIVR